MYVLLNLQLWKDFEPNFNLIGPSIEVRGPDGSTGFLCVFDSLEDLRKYSPEGEYFEIQFKKKENENA